MIEAIEKPLSGELIYDMYEEAKHSNKSFAYVAKQRLQNRANIKTIISPPDSIPDIANRAEHKPRLNHKDCDSFVVIVSLPLAKY